MRKDWYLLGLVIAILVVGLGLIGYLKISKKSITANPIPSSSGQVAGTETAKYFSSDAKVMYFYSDFCHWCQKEKDEVLPGVGDLGYKLKPMNVGVNPDLSTQYKIEGTPTFVAENGDKLVGFQEKDALIKFLDEHK